MRYNTVFAFLIFLNIVSFANNSIIYLEPVPGANYVSPENDIIVGFDKPINVSRAELINSIYVSGTKSGFHTGSYVVCCGGTKLLFKPDVPFEKGETVSIELRSFLSKSAVPGSDRYTYTFTVSERKPDLGMLEDIGSNTGTIPFTMNHTDSVQAFPTLTVTVNDNPAPGDIFLSNYYYNGVMPYLIITNTQGVPYWYKLCNTDCDDFKVQPNGHLTYYDVGSHKHYEMDQSYHIVNTYVCGNGYATDPHDLRLTLNGHAYLMAYDSEYVNMRLIVPGGDTNAVVVGLILQELDENKNVVFQWRSWDHFAITDAWHENLTAHVIDAVHGNSIEIDNDNNLIISSRHLDEVTKIDHTTGSIIWRFGGKNNQFTFIGDTLKFTYQHAARRIANGNITLFDNGNFHTPHFSRAVEYAIDEVNKTAAVVWEYRHTPDIYGFAMGYVQRLSNGNTFICWGLTNPTVTEVKPDGTSAFEMTLPQGDFSYRAYKMDWNGPPIGIQNQESNVPAVYNLKQNYPNPFNPTTSIEYSVPIKGVVKISVYDVLGNEIKTILDEMKEPGNYSISFDASNFSSGVYFYRMLSGSFSETRKMILIK